MSIKLPISYHASVIDAWPAVFAWSSFIFVHRSGLHSTRPIPFCLVLCWSSLNNILPLRSIITETAGAFELATQIWNDFFRIADNFSSFDPLMFASSVTVTERWYSTLFLNTPLSMAKFMAVSGGSLIGNAHLIMRHITHLMGPELASSNLELLWSLIQEEPTLLESKHLMKKLVLYCIQQLELCANASGPDCGKHVQLVIPMAFRCLGSGMLCGRGVKWIQYSINSGLLRAFLGCGHFLHLLDETKQNFIVLILRWILPPKRFCADVFRPIQNAMVALDSQPSVYERLERSGSPLLSVWEEFVKCFRENHLLSKPAFDPPTKTSCYNALVALSRLCGILNVLIPIQCTQTSNTMMRCSSCLVAVYCSKLCQAHDRARHVHFCIVKGTTELECTSSHWIVKA